MPKSDNAPQLLAALKAVSAVRPSNWDDSEDPEQVAAWQAVDAAIAGGESAARKARWARVWSGDWPRLPALFERKIAVLSARGGR